MAISRTEKLVALASIAGGACLAAYAISAVVTAPPLPSGPKQISALPAASAAIPVLSIDKPTATLATPSVPPSKTDQPFIATPSNKYEWSPDKLPVDWPGFTKLNERPLPTKTTTAKIDLALSLIAQWNQYKAGASKSYPASKDTDVGIKYLLSIPRNDPAFPQAWATFIKLKQIDEAVADERAAVAAREEQKKQAKQRGVSVGMTAQQVIESSWGKPQKVNVTITSRGRHEQWVYAGFQYLYFEDGTLTSIQTSR